MPREPIRLETILNSKWDIGSSERHCTPQLQGQEKRRLQWSVYSGVSLKPFIIILSLRCGEQKRQNPPREASANFIPAAPCVVDSDCTDSRFWSGGFRYLSFLKWKRVTQR